MKKAIVLFLLASAPCYSQSIKEYCTGNFSESCFLYIDGAIQSNIGERLLRLERSDASRVVLNSPGGDLGGGISLGLAIRSLGFTTEVGRASQDPESFPILDDHAGRCDSACAYAFLGGVERDSNSVSRLGFHRFYYPTDIGDRRLGYAGILRSIASEEAQKVSAALVVYLVEMGVDARMLADFQNHGPNSVHVFDLVDAQRYGIVTNRRFGPWFIEPYGNSIIAATRKVGTSSGYDQVYQATTYCRNRSGRRQSYLLMSVPLQDYSDPDSLVAAGATVSFGLGEENRSLVIDSSRVRAWKDKNFMQVELALDGDIARILTNHDTFRVSMNTGRAQGLFYYDGQTTKREKDFIKASFYHCN